MNTLNKFECLEQEPLNKSNHDELPKRRNYYSFINNQLLIWPSTTPYQTRIPSTPAYSPRTRHPQSLNLQLSMKLSSPAAEPQRQLASPCPNKFSSPEYAYRSASFRVFAPGSVPSVVAFALSCPETMWKADFLPFPVFIHLFLLVSHCSIS